MELGGIIEAVKGIIEAGKGYRNQGKFAKIVIGNNQNPDPDILEKNQLPENPSEHFMRGVEFYRQIHPFVTEEIEKRVLAVMSGLSGSKPKEVQAETIKGVLSALKRIGEYPPKDMEEGGKNDVQLHTH
ncbi:MAG: hypothetical protein WC810_25170 [Janthinobacterium sp.]|jgi:hypothetical protein